MLRTYSLLMLLIVRGRAQDKQCTEVHMTLLISVGQQNSLYTFLILEGLTVRSRQRYDLRVQAYKITPLELQIGSIADAILCRIAASHC